MEGSKEVKGEIKIFIMDEYSEEMYTVKTYKSIVDKLNLMKEITMFCSDWIQYENEEATKIADNILLDNNITNVKKSRKS